MSTAGGGGRIPLVTPLTIYGQPGIQRHKKRDFLGSQLEYFFFFLLFLFQSVRGKNKTNRLESATFRGLVQLPVVLACYSTEGNTLAEQPQNKTARKGKTKKNIRTRKRDGWDKLFLSRVFTGSD